MAAYGWNFGHGMGSFNNFEPPRPTSQIACRICSQVFLSTQALIDHIETHMGDQQNPNSTTTTTTAPPSAPPSSTSRRAYQFNISSAVPSTQLFVTPSAHSHRRSHSFQSPFFVGGGGVVAPSFVSSRPFAKPPVLPLPLVGRNTAHTTGAGGVPFNILEAYQHGVGIINYEQLQLQQQQPPIGDFTKPFLQQLEKPISHKFDQFRSGFKSSDRDMLDLNLKL